MHFKLMHSIAIILMQITTKLHKYYKLLFNTHTHTNTFKIKNLKKML